MDVAKTTLNGETALKAVEKVIITKINTDITTQKDFCSSNLSKEIKLVYEDIMERTKGPSEEELAQKEKEAEDNMAFLNNATPSGEKPSSAEEAMNLKLKTVINMIQAL